jgi:hypothetical protein
MTDTKITGVAGMGIKKCLVTFDELARHPETEFIWADAPVVEHGGLFRRVDDWVPGRIIADDRIELVDAFCRPTEVEDALHMNIDKAIGHGNFGQFVHD